MISNSYKHPNGDETTDCVIPLSEPHLLFKENCHSFSVSLRLLSLTFVGLKEAKKRIARLSNIFAVQKYLCLTRTFFFCPFKSRFLHSHRGIAQIHSTNRPSGLRL